VKGVINIDNKQVSFTMPKNDKLYSIQNYQTAVV